jgi:hypothetical protein
MLMFTNAIMYNNCNHNVHKMAVEMYDDVMTHIEYNCHTMSNSFSALFLIKILWEAGITKIFSIQK